HVVGRAVVVGVVAEPHVVTTPYVLGEGTGHILARNEQFCERRCAPDVPPQPDRNPPVGAPTPLSSIGSAVPLWSRRTPKVSKSRRPPCEMCVSWPGERHPAHRKMCATTSSISPGSAGRMC